jgi:hypothetical protein
MDKKKIAIYVFVVYMLTLMFLSSGVMALSYLDWQTFGSDYSAMPQAQLSTSYGGFNGNVSKVSISAGQTYSHALSPFQPLVSSLGSVVESFIIFPNGNFLQVYDKTLSLVDEIISGTPNSQIDIGEFNGDGFSNDIAGIFVYNSTDVAFKVYNFNHATNTLSLYQEVNFSLGLSSASSGVRCSGNLCYVYLSSFNSTTYNNSFYKIYTNGSFSSQFVDYTLNPILESPSFNDINADGNYEFALFSQDKIMITDSNGVLLKNYTFTGNQRARGVKFFRPDASNQLKIAYIWEGGASSSCGAGLYNCVNLTVVKNDYSPYWSNIVEFGQSSGDVGRSQGFAIQDYDEDGLDDIYVVASSGTSNPRTQFKIYRGLSGIIIMQKNDMSIVNTQYPNAFTTIARMDLDVNFDFITMSTNKLYVLSATSITPASNILLYNDNLTGNYQCIPADVTYDGFLDVLCSGTSGTVLYTSNYTNDNAYIVSVAFDPSTTIAVSSTINAIISASDTEGDQKVYRIRCNDNESFSMGGLNSVQSCFYNQVGIYNLTVAVRDIFHSAYDDELSQLITVTTNGGTCNFNGVCDFSLGESFSNCPSDCSANQTEVIQAGVNGLALPMKLVDVNNTDSGLLPSIYRSMLAFLSLILPYLIPLVLVVLFMMTLLAFVGLIIRKLM